MKRLSERDLTRIVKRVIKEQDNSLFSQIKQVIRDSNESNDSVIDILRMIADEMEENMSMRKGTLNRWDRENKRSHKRGGLDPKNEF